jgi:hypothetical protein
MTQFNSLTVVMCTYYLHSIEGVSILKIQSIARSNKYPESRDVRPEARKR